MSTHVFLTAAGLLAVAGLAVGGDPPKDDPDVAKLVKDLGSPRFAVREAAELKLIDLGWKAKAAVMAGMKDSDSEVARRCEAVLPKVLVAEGKAVADGTVDWPAPAGTRFRDLAGDSKEARKLFALMTADDRRAHMAFQAAADPALAARLYAAEQDRLMKAADRATREYLRQPAEYQRKVTFADVHRAAISPGEVALPLFLGALVPAGGAADVAASASAMLRASFYELAAGPLQEPTGRLFVAWLDRRRDLGAVHDGLEAALFADVDWANPAARRWAADKAAHGYVVGMALVVLGHRGTQDDLKLLSALRDDSRTYGGGHHPRRVGVKVEVQVRDVAAAMSLRLRSQDLKPYGFDPKENKTSWGRPDLPRFVTPAGFAPDEESRAVTLKKAWDWLDKQPGAPPLPKK